MLRILVVVLMGLFAQDSLAQKDEVALKYANTITAKDLRTRLEIIASDAFEGRETGQPGQKKAAAYIRDRFKEFGFAPVEQLNGYYQPFKLQLTYPDTVKLTVGNDMLEFLRDMYYFPGFGDMLMKTKDLIYLGYGISSDNYNDYKEVSAQGRVVLISGGEPKSKKGKSWVDPSATASEWTSDWTKKIALAEEKGVRTLLIIDDNFTSSVVQFGRYIKRPNIDIADKPKNDSEAMPVIYITSKMANSILKGGGSRQTHQKLEKSINKKGKPERLELGVPVTLDVKKNREELTSENVLACMEGSEIENELVIITAHYDHLGIKDGEIYNGADDDGSGTSTLLEIAEAFSLARKDGNGPKRSMLFMTVSGEEKGLLGSEYYTDNPVFPLSNTVVDLNVDMIGRIDENHAPDSNYVYLIGADKLSTELHELSERMNTTYSGLALDYTYNDEDDPNRFYYRSDHYNFAKNNIPVIFYFTGVHEDYHQPTDTVDKIMFPKTEKIARLIFHTAWEIANREKRLEVDVEPTEDE